MVPSLLNRPRSSERPVADPVIGIDIGGAFLKYASTERRTLSREFPLWMRPDELADRLQADLSEFPTAAQIVATMTGEMADCFLDRSVGVKQIVDHLSRVTGRLRLPVPQFYSVDNAFCSAGDAIANPDAVASSNWHALATYAGAHFGEVNQTCLLVDIGSTTTDLIPIDAGKVATDSRTDFDRLAEGTLVYLGGKRTPVCSVIDRLEFRGGTIPLMREVFATMDDVRILLGYENECESDHGTADGQPRALFHAANRLARMIGSDHRTVSIVEAQQMARQVHQQAVEIVTAAINRFGQDVPIIVSGHADDLAGSCLQQTQVVSMSQRLGESLSRCAPAYAVAELFLDRQTKSDLEGRAVFE